MYTRQLQAVKLKDAT